MTILYKSCFVCCNKQNKSRANSQPHHATTPRAYSPHTGGAPLRTRHRTEPTTEAANLAAPPPLAHTYARISARTTADQRAAKPRERQNARASGRTEEAEHAHAPPAAPRSAGPLRATAAARRWPRRAAAAPWACRGSVLRAWAHISPLRSSTRTSSMRAMGGPFKHPQQQKWGTRGKGGATGQSTHRRNAQRGRIFQNGRARGRRCRSEISVGPSWKTLSSATCGTGHDFMFS